MPGLRIDNDLNSGVYLPLARVSLLCVAVCGASTACVLGEPDHTPPDQTRPYLQAVSPAITEVRPIFQINPGLFPQLTFQFTVQSEDNGDDLQAILLRDYGTPSPFVPNQPYHTAVAERPIAAGTFDQGPRDHNITIPLQLENNQSHECRRYTVMVVRDRFATSPFADCPADFDMHATLTWFVPICDTLSNCDAQDCVGEPEGGYVYCPDDLVQALKDIEE